MRRFEKITKPNFLKTFATFLAKNSASFSSAQKDANLSALYDSFPLPSRGTSAAAGYDFFLASDLLLPAGKTVLVPSGIKATFPPNEFLLLALRSSAGIKHHLRLSNQIGVIDADYYNNQENEGQIFYSLENLGSEDKFFSAGDHLIQGIFLEYKKISEDIPRKQTRKGKY